MFSLKSSSVLTVESVDGNIDGFIYELFTKFSHQINSAEHTIMLSKKQINTIEIQNNVDSIVKKYSERIPQINNLNSFLRKLDINEYFFLIVLQRELSQEEVYKLGVQLMQLNIPDFNIVEHMKLGNELFRNIWDGYTVITHGIEKKVKIGESDKTKRVCRFCGKTTSSGATFRNESHAISESLGNKKLIFNEECDDCNAYFGQTIERALITYLSVYKTFFGILNKSNKVPTIKGKNFEYKNLGNKNIELVFTSADPQIDTTTPPENILLIFNETLIQQDIYKALVKYALSVIEKINDEVFKNTIVWLRTSEYKNALPKIGVLASYALFKDEPTISVYLRKNDDKSIPYAVGEFHFTFLTFVFIIPTFSSIENEFIQDSEYKHFWEYFKHFDLSKDFKFEDFSNKDNHEVRFNLTFEQRTQE